MKREIREEHARRDQGEGNSPADDEARVMASFGDHQDIIETTAHSISRTSPVPFVPVQDRDSDYAITASREHSCRGIGGFVGCHFRLVVRDGDTSPFVRSQVSWRKTGLRRKVLRMGVQ
jgi:hypothetical protein